ncbi:MAG: hypothetical protein RLO08_02145 [Parvibaculaceae bacterium]|jgi:hypothetical protein
MPTSNEIISALVGAWKIARRDPSAMQAFDFSADAFWRSFAAFIFAVPFYLVFITAEWRMIGDAGIEIVTTLPAYTLIELLSYAAYWALYPLTMVFICRSFGLTATYAPYIIVYNWSSILVAVLMAPPYVLYSLGLASSETAALLVFVAFVTALLYRWQIALTVLGTTSSIAAAVVAVELVLGILISMVASGFLSIGA